MAEQEEHEQQQGHDANEFSGSHEMLPFRGSTKFARSRSSRCSKKDGIDARPHPRHSEAWRTSCRRISAPRDHFLYCLLSPLSTFSTFYCLHFLLSPLSTVSTFYFLYFLLSLVPTFSSIRCFPHVLICYLFLDLLAFSMIC